MTRHDDPGTAVPFSLVIKGKLDLGPFRKMPLGEETDPSWRPVNLVLDQINGIGITDRYAIAIIKP